MRRFEDDIFPAISSLAKAAEVHSVKGDVGIWVRIKQEILNFVRALEWTPGPLLDRNRETLQ